jgi:hypothetical protein
LIIAPFSHASKLKLIGVNFSPTGINKLLSVSVMFSFRCLQLAPASAIPSPLQKKKKKKKKKKRKTKKKRYHNHCACLVELDAIVSIHTILLQKMFPFCVALYNIISCHVKTDVISCGMHLQNDLTEGRVCVLDNTIAPCFTALMRDLIMLTFFQQPHRPLGKKPLGFSTTSLTPSLTNVTLYL